MGINSAGAGIDRAGYEKQWAAHEARHKLGKEDRALFDASRFTFRPYVYFNKILIVWRIVKGEPQVKEVLKVVGIDVSFPDGVWITLHADVANRDISLSHTPRRLLDLDVMAWVPFFNEFRFASAKWEDPDAPKNLRLCVCFKTRTAPDEHANLTEGHDYLSELHVFRQIFPQYASTRF